MFMNHSTSNYHNTNHCKRYSPFFLSRSPMALSINEEGEEFYEAEGGAVSDKSPAAYRFVLMVFCS